MKISIFVLSVIAAPFFIAAANADSCAIDSMGKVVCAPPVGGAAVDGMGQVVTGRGECVRNDMGQVVCSDSPGGGAAVDAMGRVRTGVGQCVRDNMGQVIYSSQPFGSAAVNGMRQPVCQGGCVPGQ